MKYINSIVHIVACLYKNTQVILLMDAELIEQFYKSFNPNLPLLKGATNHSKSKMHSKWNDLLKTQSLPEHGWTEPAIEAFLLELSAMDCNNFDGVVGMGEREGRIASNLIKRRHFG